MSFIYLFINFIWSAYLLDGTPDIKDGQCFLHNREEFIGI